MMFQFILGTITKQMNNPLFMGILSFFKKSIHTVTCGGLWFEAVFVDAGALVTLACTSPVTRIACEVSHAQTV